MTWSRRTSRCGNSSPSSNVVVLDHVIVLGETHLRRVLRSYFDYYHRSRMHLSLEKDASEPREVQSPVLGEVIELPQVGGLYHRYERRAA